MNTLLKKSAACVAVTLLAVAVNTTAFAAPGASNVSKLLKQAPYQALFNTLHPNVDELTAAVNAMLSAATVGNKQYLRQNALT